MPVQSVVISLRSLAYNVEVMHTASIWATSQGWIRGDEQMKQRMYNRRREIYGFVKLHAVRVSNPWRLRFFKHQHHSLCNTCHTVGPGGHAEHKVELQTYRPNPAAAAAMQNYKGVCKGLTCLLLARLLRSVNIFHCCHTSEVSLPAWCATAVCCSCPFLLCFDVYSCHAFNIK